MTTSTPIVPMTHHVSGSCSAAENAVVVLVNASTGREVFGPFPTLTQAQTFAHRSLPNLPEEAITFPCPRDYDNAKFASWQVASAWAVVDGVLDKSSSGEGAAHVVVVTARDGTGAVRGPFPSRGKAQAFADSVEAALDGHEGVVVPLRDRNGDRMAGAAFCAILTALADCGWLLRSAVLGIEGLAINDVGDIECTECEYLPLIGVYGHFCGNEYRDHWC
ncbi:hypothetical protein EXE58_06045 [Nocardioides seonyuensis]|uniref:Uncharacterized protein n=1 Tax=Nocardioides seonyuensis TaxID=2518371 RepID=A0A4P7IG98_9ACTN|nr:hypothetical protein [Nocardioides seonyuensis]QBX55057.1 hypothetical protein EXE58_06045 [Nocardioides seonyuensis]